MTAFVNSAVDLIGAYQEWAYALVFLLSFAESFPLVGGLIPGSTIIFAISTMVPSGAVALLPLLGSAIVGAIVGDGFSYWLGHRYRETIAQKWPFNRSPGLVERGRAFFDHHGRKSILVARFTPPIRAVVPLVAGILGMPARSFYAINVTSALLWAPAHILPGALVGASLVLAHAVSGRLAVFAGLVLLLVWAAVLIVRLALHRGLPLLARGQDHVQRWARGRTDWGGRQVARLFDLTARDQYALILLGALMIAGLWVFLGVLEDVVSGDPLVHADVAVYHLLQALRTTWGDRFMVVVTEIGDAPVTTALTLTVLAWLLWRRAWRAAGYWLGAVVSATLFTNLLKVILHVPRPVDLYTGWSTFSFPSGHATVNAVIYGLLAVLIAREVAPRWGRIGAFAAAALVALIAFSRLYLGAHWISDVAAGVAFGTAWTALFGIISLRHDLPKLNAGGLATVTVATVFLAGGVHVGMQFSNDIGRYGVRQQLRTVRASVWWANGWQGIASHRIDLAGEQEERLVLQWAGGLDSLRSRLIGDAWRVPPPWSVAAAATWLDSAADPLSRPLLPRLHDGRPPALALIRSTGDGTPSADRWVLRVWSTQTSLTAPGGKPQPLWVGALTLQHLGGVLPPFDVDLRSGRGTPPWPMLEHALKGAVLEVRTDDRTGARVLLAHDPS